MSGIVSDFLAESETRLAKLDAELARQESAPCVAWTLCEFSGRELDLVDCVAYLLESDTMLVQQAAWGPKRAADHILESRIHLAVGKGVVGACAQSRQPQRVDDTRQDPRYVVDDQDNLSELAVPLVDGDTLLGVLDSEHPKPRYYDGRHEQALLAIAARGARRLRELRERIRRGG